MTDRFMRAQRSTERVNSTPTFLGVTFDRTLSFTKHVSSLKAKFFPRLKALRCISASSWGPSKESLSVLYKSFLQSFLTYASPGWFSFLSATNLTKLERLHRAASRAITGCLSSSPIPLLLTEASLPPLLASCLSRIGKIENPFCSACVHPSQDIFHLILHCPATDSLRRSLFGDSLSLYDLWSRPWGVARLLELHGLPPCPHPSEGVR